MISANRSPSRAVRTRILVVDDHPLVREGLAVRISAQPDLEVCCVASDLEEAWTRVREQPPDLVILDLAFNRGSGLDLIKKVATGLAKPKILVVSAYEEELFAERVLCAGAQGYLNKVELSGSVIEAIRVVIEGGGLYLSAAMARRIASQTITGGHASGGLEVLSDRELQVFELIGRGQRTRTIAEQLHLSVHTIESHRENIRRKLSLRSGTELMRLAVLWTLGRAS